MDLFVDGDHEYVVFSWEDEHGHRQALGSSGGRVDQDRVDAPA
ncbi:hypothetical protein [Geodermatophilus sp. SYSU D00766]